jgi:aminodeoxyfutalosine deaminase
MRFFSAQYIITNTGPPVKRGIVSTSDDGTIISIEENHGHPGEKRNTEFHNGILIPGFVNCHCHLELSHLKGILSRGSGLEEFIMQVRTKRNFRDEDITEAASNADAEMKRGGIVLCADICNTPLTFGIKQESIIKYVNLLEVFGIDPKKAKKRIEETDRIAVTAGNMGLDYSLTPHSVYSVSLPLFRLLKERSSENCITSFHFLESANEKSFLENHSGPLANSYLSSGLLPSTLETVKSHVVAVMEEITDSGNLILVHNTHADRDTIRSISNRQNLFWCLCPNSNLYIGGKTPPLDILIEEGCEITIGTDSLASNEKLSILEELKTFQSDYPSLSLEKLIRWSTLNGAKALNQDKLFGTLEPGKKPGLLLLRNIDMHNMKILPESNITRLI